jgi:hypothetical protein
MTRVERTEALQTPASTNVAEDKNPTGLPEKFQVRVHINGRDKILCDARFVAAAPHTAKRDAYVYDHGPKVPGGRGLVAEFYLKPHEAQAYDSAIKSAFYKEGAAELHHPYSVHRERPGGHPRVALDPNAPAKSKPKR